MLLGRKRILLTAVIVWAGSCALAQQPDSVIALREVAIVASPVRQVATATFNENISPVLISGYNSRPVSELLARSSGVIINQYGPGGLSTISLRGAGSSQTAVLWNGLNLQSPMNGGMNLSQLPVNFIDEIEINHGGQGAQKGNSAIGGVLQLNSSADVPEGFAASVTQSAGSFGNVFSGLKVHYGSGKLAFSTRIFHQSADNDFSFINTAQYGKPEMKQPNAALKQYGVLQTALWQIATGQQLIARIWAQKYDKKIPPLMTNLDSRQRQVDDDYRGVVEWKGLASRFQWLLRSGYIYNKQIYTDEATDLVADNRSSSWQNNFEGSWHINDRHSIIVQGGSTFETGRSDNYTTVRRRNITWLMTGYRLALDENKAVFMASVREEFADLTTTTPTFSVGSDVVLNKFLSLHANIARSYRMPTLNDLYWSIWGNPDLKPEQGYTFDLGVSFRQKSGRWQTDASATVYSNHISDWIIWLPEGTIWRPQNLKKVWARGIESQAEINYSAGKFNTGLMVKYQYTRAAQMKTGADESLQLIYQPRHRCVASVSAGYSRFDISYIQSYTGIRYSDESNQNPLDAYTTGDLSAGTSFVFHKWKAETRLSINNITNTTYQAIAWYAMPGQSFELSITLLFNNNL